MPTSSPVKRVGKAPERGIVAGELAMSFRSNEFVDDAVRDNQATNALEIKDKGWAFGQIADMEAWYASLRADGKLSESDTLTVTGYSLGGQTPAEMFSVSVASTG